MENSERKNISNSAYSNNDSLVKLRNIHSAKQQHQNTKYLKTLVENSLDILMVLNNDGTIRFLSKSAEEILGKQPEKVIDTNIIEYIHPRECEKFKQRFNSLIHNPKKTDFSVFKVRHVNGSFRYIENISRQIVDSGGELCIMVNARDVTERMKVQGILEKSQEQLTIAQKIAQVGSWEWDFKKDVIRWSKELRRIYGNTSDRLLCDYDSFLKYIHPGDREYFSSMIENAILEKSTFNIDYRIQRIDGDERRIHTKGEVICDKHKNPIKIIATGQDITDFKKAENQLLEYSEQLKNYNAKQDMIIENERNQIARDIHDDLGQMLTVLKMDIFQIKDRVKQEVGEEVAAGFNDDMKNILERFDTLVNSVQKITTSLRPEEIDDLGLVDAIRWQCGEFEAQTGIDCNFINKAKKLSGITKEYRKAIFRIFQQALNNISEHAKASRAKVKLTIDEKFFILEVWDNGTGIKENQVMHPNSFGLLSMRERSHYLGGEFSITGKKDEGTTVTLKIPVEEIIFKY